ncbi:hypothetical protein [Levilactobacillus parabrevis]|uniref:hypothetical protein n=1 Tax=Levilactobacillus parabrevis TaxID=357278 RepID=UPI0037579B58
MKKQILFMALLGGLTLGGTQIVAPTAAQASTRKTVKALPKKLQGAWYHYDGHGKHDRVKFTATKWRTVGYQNGSRYASTSTLHQRKLNADPDKLARHANWVVGWKMTVRRANWTDLRGWNQSAGDGTYYKVANKRYHGQKLAVLSEAGGAGVWVTQHYYASKQVAKQMKNHRFHSEVYYA